MRRRATTSAVWWSWAGPLSALMVLSGCVHLDSTDSFPQPAEVVDPGPVQSALPAGARLEVLPLPAASAVRAYVVRNAGSRGSLLFCGGSGNDTIAQLKVLARPAAELGLDLVAFSYYVRGEPLPTVTEAMNGVLAVYQATAALHDHPESTLFVAGHSLGAWFALQLATSEPVAGLLLVGAGTTPAALIRRTDHWSVFVRLIPDAEERRLDSSSYAPRVIAPTIVISSARDTQVPADNSRLVYEQLGSASYAANRPFLKSSTACSIS